MRKALVLSAGGMFGAYQAGAWEVLSASFKPDIVVGASIGCLNGWAIAGGCDPRELSDRWIGLNDTSRKLDGQKLHRWIQDLYAAYQPQMQYGVVVTDLLRLKPKLFTTPGIGWSTSPHRARSSASCRRYESKAGCTVTVGYCIQSRCGQHVRWSTEIVVINVLPRMPGWFSRPASERSGRSRRSRPPCPTGRE